MMPKVPRTTLFGRRSVRSAACAVLLAAAPPLAALSFDFRDGELRLDIDTILSYSAQWRVTKVDDDLFAYRDTGNLITDTSRYAILLNADDGDRNFSRGVVQNKISAVSEVKLEWRNIGFFARGRGYYDAVYDDDTDQNERAYESYNGAIPFGGDVGFRKFPDKTVDRHRDRLEMLDYFVYTSGELPGDRRFDLRLGSQVINWGEATFFAGISGLQNRADLIARNTPGVQVKEILLPTGAVYGQVDLTPELTLESYYQYEWRETELNGVGSYFSDRDFLGPGAQNFLVPLRDQVFAVAPRTPDDKASDDGQWGAGLHWITAGGTDFGLYYVNAHNKAPAYQLNYEGAVPANYTIRYFEDIQGYAASFTTVLGSTNVQGEISWKSDVPVVLNDGNPVEGDMLSAQVGGSMVFTPTRFWDDLSVVFEFTAAHIDSHDSDELRYDDFATAFALLAEFSYLNKIPGLDLSVPIFLQHTFDGTILEAQMASEATTFNIALKGVYLNNLTAAVGYTDYFGGGDDHLLTDRDNVSFNISYSF